MFILFYLFSQLLFTDSKLNFIAFSSEVTVYVFAHELCLDVAIFMVCVHFSLFRSLLPGQEANVHKAEGGERLPTGKAHTCSRRRRMLTNEQ